MIPISQVQVPYVPGKNILKLALLIYSTPAFALCLPLCFSVVFASSDLRIIKCS